MSEKVELKEKIQAVDMNIRELWDSMDETNQKNLKSELFILNRYISNVKSSSREVQEHFVLTVNEFFNKNFYNLQKHPKLLWMSLCMCSYDGQKVFYHEWIGRGKGAGTKNKAQKFLSEIYPNARADEIELLDKIMSSKQVKDLAVQHGFSDVEIKKML